MLASLSLSEALNDSPSTIVCLGEAGRNPSSDDRLLRTPLEDDFDLDDLTPIIFFICLLKLLNDAMIDVEDAPLAFFDSSSAAARAMASESPKPDMPACTLMLPIRAFFASDLCTAPWDLTDEKTFPLRMLRSPALPPTPSTFLALSAIVLCVGDGDAGQLSRLDPESLAFIEPDGAPS